MPITADCSPRASLAQPRFVELQQQGALIEVILRSPFTSSAEITLTALVDTGTQSLCLEDDTIRQLNPNVVNRLLVAGMGNPIPVYKDVFGVEIEIPALNMREFTSALGGKPVGGKQQALLGREQLLNCILSYDGPRGIVTLTR